MEVTAAERIIIERLRAIQSNGGHGTLRVDVTDGHASFLKREHSEKLPR